MDVIFNFVGMIIVAIIGLLGIIIQTKSHDKIEKQDVIVKDINSKIDALRKESKEDDIRLNAKLDETRMNALKRFLITELTKIKNKEYIPTDYQRRMISEAKDEYNKAGGDSYVDDMYDEINDKKMI